MSWHLEILKKLWILLKCGPILYFPFFPRLFRWLLLLPFYRPFLATELSEISDVSQAPTKVLPEPLKYFLLLFSICIIVLLIRQGHGRIGGHYFHSGCPYVRPSQKQIRTTTDTIMHENNDHLLAGAWWVTLKSPDLYYVSISLVIIYHYHFII